MNATQLSATLVGMKYPEAEGLAQQRGFILRVMVEDGKDCIGSCECRSNRINVEISKGTITEVINHG